MSERYKSMIVVDLMLTRKNEKSGKEEVLLALRKNTGSHDGEYELPGGHVEAGEDLMQAMIREAKEELNIDICRDDLKIVYILHNYRSDRINFILTTKGYKGTLSIGEPDKCEKIEWFELDKLPENTTKKIKNSLKEICLNIFYDDIEFRNLQIDKNDIGGKKG